MPVLPFCDPESISAVFGSISSATMLCDIGLAASVLAVIVHPKRRACCQEARGIPVVRWLIAYVVVIAGTLSSGRMNPLRPPQASFSFGDVLVFFGFAIALSACVQMRWDRQHWDFAVYIRTLGMVTIGFFMGCFMVSHATNGWSVDCEKINDLIVPCLPESFYIAACAGIAACMMGAVVGVVFFVAADEVSFNHGSTDFLMLVVALVIVAITLAGFEYSSAKVYGGGVSDDAPAAQDVSSLGMVGTFFQCAGLIGGGSYATAGVMATSANVHAPPRNAASPLPPRGEGLEELARTGSSERNGSSAGTDRGQHRHNFGCSIVNCIGRVAVAASAWCAGGVVVLTASQKDSSCTSAASRVGNETAAAGSFIKVRRSDGFSAEVQVLHQATVETGKQVLSRPWVKHALAAFSQVWAPAVIGLILLGSAGQVLTIAACRGSPPIVDSLVGQPFEAEIELAIADNWRSAEPAVEAVHEDEA